MTDSDTFIPALYKPSALLPIAQYRDALLYAVESHPVTILVGQTGSGKTTQLPQFLEQAGWCNDGKLVAVTQASPSASHLQHHAMPVDRQSLTASLPFSPGE